MARRLGIAAVLVALSWSLLPTGALAGSGVLFDLRINSSCAKGTAPAGASLRVVWRRPNGKVMARESYAPFEGGDWAACANGRLKGGDRVTVTLDGVKRRLVVPSLTIAVDRVADVVYGRAPAGAIVHVDLPFEADVTAGSDGTWSYHREGTDIYGAAFGSAHWNSRAGDRVTFWAFTPQIFLTLGDPTVHAFGHPGTTATITLTRQTSTGTRVATLHESFGWTGEIWDAFVDAAGRTMRVKVGDHISAPQIAADMDWIVPGMSASGDPATNVVNGRCLDSGWRLGYFYVAVLDNSERAKGHAAGWADDTGRFSIDFDDPTASTGDQSARPADIVSGDFLRVECEQVTGDFVIGQFRVR